MFLLFILTTANNMITDCWWSNYHSA